MTIRFTVCPYHEPSPVGYERTMVVDDFTRQFKCAACDEGGTLNADGSFPMARIGKLGLLANTENEKLVKSAKVYEDEKAEFWKAHDEALKKLTPTQKRWKSELQDSRPKIERLFGKESSNA